MFSADAQTIIGLTGLLAQFAASLLLVALYLLLKRQARRRVYFRYWGWAWGALAIAIGALVVRYLLMPPITTSPPPDVVLIVPPLYFIYQYAKLLHWILLAAGAAMYARGTRVDPFLRWGLPIAAAYALLGLLSTPGLYGVVAWQAPVAVLGLGCSAALLLWLPTSRRGLGSRFTGWGFVASALVWLIYFWAFGLRPDGGLHALVSFNSLIDGFADIVLGYGMVVMLLEDEKKEVDAAHAELSVAHDHLRRAALYDALTGALNRRAYEEGVGLEHIRGSYGGVAVLDLDNLKDVNDADGHAAGDALLCRLVDVLRGGLRHSDKLYRWGGDEFLLLLPRAAHGDARVRLAALIDTANTTVAGHAMPLRVSIGTAEYKSGEALAAAIDAADHAMYEEKNRKKLMLRVEVRPEVPA